MRVGILGGGQLGRMIALAGYALGLRFRCLEPSEEAPMGHLADLELGAYDDPDALARFAAGLAVVTYEFENVPVASARLLERSVPVYPPPAALAAAQDRLREKQAFDEAGIPVPPYEAVEDEAGLRAAVERIGVPAVLKTRRMGYDGKGQFVLRGEDDVAAAWQAIGGVPLLLEAFVAFEREVSLLAVRSRTGETLFYPLVENHHRDGILRLSLAPAPALDPALQALAESHAARLLERLDYVGVLAIEFFQRDGLLLANEMAPRVHNSGHWTIEGAETSQFENHLRAILGYPLGPACCRGLSAMLNIVGDSPDPATLLGAVPDAHLHYYDKAPRPGRKLGHVTVRADDAPGLATRLGPMRELLFPESMSD